MGNPVVNGILVAFAIMIALVVAFVLWFYLSGKNTFCKNDCNSDKGYGWCNVLSLGCKCNGKVTGPDCSVPAPCFGKKPEDKPCSDHGQCSAINGCLCYQGYCGDDCSKSGDDCK